MAVPGMPDLARLRAMGVRRLSAGIAIAQNSWRQSVDTFRVFLERGSTTGLFEGAAAYFEVQDLFTAT